MRRSGLRPAAGVLTASAVLVASAVFLTANRLLLADGGTLRVANVPMGAYRLNVFTDPTPITPDSIDVSALVTFERGRGVARGLDIQVEARRVDGTGSPIRHPATREQADDPRFYAAKFSLASVGEWEIVVRLAGPEGRGEVSFSVQVQEPGLLDNPYLILLAAFLPLVLVGWWLRSPSSRPGD